ncbi:hypothetical protein M758_1G195700 [Ceratodon purpureus]|nr:hypothetical protein M758_1G195700 [Ceratodon purpureus]
MCKHLPQISSKSDQDCILKLRFQCRTGQSRRVRCTPKLKREKYRPFAHIHQHNTRLPNAPESQTSTPHQPPPSIHEAQQQLGQVTSLINLHRRARNQPDRNLSDLSDLSDLGEPDRT